MHAPREFQLAQMSAERNDKVSLFLQCRCSPSQQYGILFLALVSFWIVSSDRRSLLQQMARRPEIRLRCGGKPKLAQRHCLSDSGKNPTLQRHTNSDYGDIMFHGLRWKAGMWNEVHHISVLTLARGRTEIGYRCIITHYGHLPISPFTQSIETSITIMAWNRHESA